MSTIATPTREQMYSFPRKIRVAESGLTHYKNELVSTEEIVNSSVEIFDFPVRDGKTLPNFDFILPKFHLILPKFCFAPPWGNPASSLTLPDFLGRRVTVVGTHGRASVPVKGYDVQFLR